MNINVVDRAIPDIKIFEPVLSFSMCGLFFEGLRQRAFEEVADLETEFVQDSNYRSIKGVLRGLLNQLSLRTQSMPVCVVGG